MMATLTKKAASQTSLENNAQSVTSFSPIKFVFLLCNNCMVLKRVDYTKLRLSQRSRLWHVMHSKNRKKFLAY